jgi:hypothetical protein
MPRVSQDQAQHPHRKRAASAPADLHQLSAALAPRREVSRALNRGIGRLRATGDDEPRLPCMAVTLSACSWPAAPHDRHLCSLTVPQHARATGGGQRLGRAPPAHASRSSSNRSQRQTLRPRRATSSSTSRVTDSPSCRQSASPMIRRRLQPLALELALATHLRISTSNVVYLARPCQYTGMLAMCRAGLLDQPSASRRKSSPRWTKLCRSSRPVTARRRLTLVGYSGGAQRWRRCWRSAATTWCASSLWPAIFPPHAGPSCRALSPLTGSLDPYDQRAKAGSHLPMAFCGSAPIAWCQQRLTATVRRRNGQRPGHLRSTALTMPAAGPSAGRHLWRRHRCRSASNGMSVKRVALATIRTK